MKLAALWPARVSVVQTRERVPFVACAPPARSPCESRQGNAQPRQSTSFCPKAAVAFTFTAWFLSSVCTGVVEVLPANRHFSRLSKDEFCER